MARPLSRGDKAVTKSKYYAKLGEFLHSDPQKFIFFIGWITLSETHLPCIQSKFLFGTAMIYL